MRQDKEKLCVVEDAVRGMIEAGVPDWYYFTLCGRGFAVGVNMGYEGARGVLVCGIWHWFTSVPYMWVSIANYIRLTCSDYSHEIHEPAMAKTFLRSRDKSRFLNLLNRQPSVRLFRAAERNKRCHKFALL